MGVIFDAVSTAASGVNTSGGVAAGTPISISAASGADVIFALQIAAGAVSGAPSNIQCNGSAMTLVDSQSADNLGDSAGTYLYRAAGAGTGSSISITYSIPNNTWYVAGAVSVTGAGVVGTAIKAFGVGTAVSSGSISVAAGQLAICAYGSGFGAAHVMGSPTGGTNQYLATTPGTAGEANLAISTSTTTATFGATNAASLQWSSVVVVLDVAPGIPGPGGSGATTAIPNRRRRPLALRRRRQQPYTPARRTGGTPPVEYDATGSGYCNAFNGTTASWLHTSRSGAYVVAVVHGYFNQDTYGTFSGETYGGVAMTPLYTVYNNNFIVGGVMTVFGLANAPPLQQTVTVTLPSSHLAIIVANTFSYRGVASVSAFPWPAYGGGASAFTLTLPNPANSIVLAAFASSVGQLASLSGGDIRHNANYAAGGGALAVMDTAIAGSAAFWATPPSAANWSGVGMVLSPLPAPTYQPAMTGPIAKFASGQNVSFFVIGDSTAFGLDDGQSLNGWVGRLGIHFGDYYDYNVVLRQYNPGSSSYGAPTSLRTSTNGGAPTLTIYAGTVSGTYASGQIISILTGNLVPISNPDVILTGTGINDTFFQTLSPAEYTVEMNMLIAYLTNIYCPGVPVIVTTQNPTSSAPEFDFPTLVANYSAMAQSLVGSPTPLGAGIVQNPNNNVSVLDTLQAYRYQYQTSLFAGANPDEHPNQWGYAVQAYWMASVLAPWIVTAIGAKAPPPTRMPNPRIVALRKRRRELQIVRRWEPNTYTAPLDCDFTLEATFPTPKRKLILNSSGQLVVDGSGSAVTSLQA